MNDRGFIVICYLSDGRGVWFLRYVELFVGVDLVGVIKNIGVLSVACNSVIN